MRRRLTVDHVQSDPAAAVRVWHMRLGEGANRNIDLGLEPIEVDRIDPLDLDDHVAAPDPAADGLQIKATRPHAASLPVIEQAVAGRGNIALVLVTLKRGEVDQRIVGEERVGPSRIVT